MRNIRTRKWLVCAVLCSILSGAFGHAHALEFTDNQDVQTRYVYTESGKKLFKVTIFDSDGPAQVFNTVTNQWESTSDYKLNEDNLTAIMKGIGYYTQLLDSNVMNKECINIFVCANEEIGDNANCRQIVDLFAANDVFYKDEYLSDFYPDVLKGEASLPQDAGIHITVGRQGYFAAHDDVDTLPNNLAGGNLNGYIIHEAMHGLGASSFWKGNNETGEVALVTNNYVENLYDMYGTKAESGMLVKNEGEGEKGKDFIIRPLDVPNYKNYYYGGAYFAGDNVNEVLNGAKLVYNDETGEYTGGGIPVTGWDVLYQDLPEFLDIPALDHLSLRNGLMSHFDYRNYNMLMEAEIAAIQDIGYNIDRKNFYGHSIYNSGSEDNFYKYINTNGYSARNEAGTAYIDAANTTSLGVGLHVYGDYVDVVQAAKINTVGAGAVGIRVDGDYCDNVTVAANVSANGEYGNGLLFANGKDHNAVIEKDVTVEAKGVNGIGARFDFGNNFLGNERLYHGSYIFSERGFTPPRDGEDGWYYMRPMVYNRFELSIEEPEAIHNGSIVKNFDIYGNLEGSKAAIYMSPNGHVKNINIHDGATIKGDIISHFGNLQQLNDSINQFDGMGYKLLPDLSDDGKLQYDKNENIIFKEALYYYEKIGGKIKVFGARFNSENQKYESVDLTTNLNFVGDHAYNDDIYSTEYYETRDFGDYGKVVVTNNYNMRINVSAGMLRFGGTATVSAVNVASDGGILGGVFDLDGIYEDSAAGYAVSDKGTLVRGEGCGVFTNAGIIGAADGNSSMEIIGDLVCEDGSSVQFTANGTDVGGISVSGSVTGLDNTKLVIDPHGVYIPEHDYKTMIIDNNGKGMQAGNLESARQYETGMLDTTVDEQKATLRFTSSDNLGQRTAEQGIMYNVIEANRKSDASLNAVYAPLYSMDAASAKSGLSVAYGGLASDTAGVIKQDHFIRDIVTERLVSADNQKAADADIWAVTRKGWRSAAKNDTVGKMSGNSFYTAIGTDKQVNDKWRVGTLASYGRHSVSVNGGKNEIDDVRLGAYARYKAEDSVHLDGYINAGLQRNDSKRNIFGTDAKARYNSDTFSVGLQVGKEFTQTNGWTLTPCVGTDYTNYRLHGFSESGADGYNLRADRQSDDVFSIRAGVNTQRTFDKGSLYMGAAYRRVVSGDDVPIDVSLGSSSYTQYANGASKDLFELNLGGSAELAQNLTLSGDVRKEFGNGIKNLSASVKVEYSF